MSRMVDFVYKFTNFDGTAKELCYPVDIPYSDDPKELCHRIVASEMHPIMQYLDNNGELMKGASNLLPIGSRK